MSSTEQDEKTFREVLPNNVTPFHYFVSLTPNLDEQHDKKFTFEGTTIVDLTVNESSDVITCNAIELIFLSASIVQCDQTIEIPGDNIVLNEKLERVEFRLPQTVKTGNAQLTVRFAGILNNNMRGFYRSKACINGQDVYWGVTQFESTDARRAFPCWDEPALKATFIVELTAPNDYNVLSNMPEASTKSNNNGTKTVLFNRSVVMSTYLLAWAIGKFDYVEQLTNRDTVVRVWASPDKKSQCNFACTVAVKTLEFYEQYFNIPYPLPKLDMIGIPDFAAGAMENWGLVTYREITLLCDEKKSSFNAKQLVAVVVCHELAHQWFGNLVTMDWWSQLWLNEGFACFMEYVSSDAIFPNWKMWNLFITREHDRAFELDAMLTSHPIEVDVRTPGEVDEIFDAISYCKGAAVIRMIESFLSRKIFQSALEKYLTNFQYSNAVTTDLWDYLSRESGKNIDSIMRTWTRNQGYPLITVNRDGNQLHITQKRFLSSGEPTPEQDTIIWAIPIVSRVYGQNETVNFLLTKREDNFELPGNPLWVKLNADTTGFYIVKYDTKSMKAINEALQNQDPLLTTLDRFSLIRDTLTLAQSGIENGTINLLNLLVSLKNETESTVWDIIISSAYEIRAIIDEDEETVQKFALIMRNLLSKISLHVGWQINKDEDIGLTLLRPIILGALGSFKDDATINVAKEKFAQFMETKNDANLPSDLRSVVFSLGIRYGGRNEWEQLREFYNTTDNPQNKQSALMALGRSSDPDLLNEALEWIFTSQDVRLQDKVFSFGVISSNLKGRQLAWTHLQEHWDEWYAMYNSGFLIQNLVKIPSRFVSQAKADEVENFFATKDVPSGVRAIKQCVETIRKYSSWKQRDIQNINEWVQQQLSQN